MTTCYYKCGDYNDTDAKAAAMYKSSHMSVSRPIVFILALQSGKMVYELSGQCLFKPLTTSESAVSWTVCDRQTDRRTDGQLYQRSEDEEDHEDASQSRGAVHVAVADRRHGDQREVDALPVGHRVNVGEVLERIAGVLHL